MAKKIEKDVPDKYPDPDKTMSDYMGWCDVINKMADDRHKKQEEFSAKLDAHPPHKFIPAPADEGGPPGGKTGIGYWCVKGGILSYRRYQSGLWDMYSKETYEIDFINMLVDLLGKVPVSL
jgi:hypothetical protein